MIEREITINNRAGIHARPAALIVQTAAKYKSKITIEKDGSRINAKSIMGIITLGAGYGAVLKLVADGEDEIDAAGALTDLFNRKFEEE